MEKEVVLEGKSEYVIEIIRHIIMSGVMKMKKIRLIFKKMKVRTG